MRLFRNLARLAIDRRSLPTRRLASRVAHLAAVTIAGAAVPLVILAQLPGTRVPGGCDVPAAQRTAAVGCYLVAAQPLDTLPAGPLYWHIYSFRTSREAVVVDSAARAVPPADGAATIVVDALEQVWLFALGPAAWRPIRGQRVAVVGPLPIAPAMRYVARYMEAVFPPGMQTAVHRHAGPEAWYLVAGRQCLQTPDTTIVASAEQSAVVTAGPPMRLTGIGRETRRSLVLVLHDAAEPWMTMTTTWTPSRAC